MKRPTWQIYERMVARLVADQVATDLCVTPNVHLLGKVSGTSRQIDVLIEARHDRDFTRRIIVDAKKHRRKLDVTDIEAFRGLMEDVDATHGYLVCPSGYTKAAERRAQQNVSIRIVPLDRIENFDPSTWPQCKNSDCKSGRIFWDGYPELSLLPIPTSRSSGQEAILRFVHYVGKCDRCGRFHVKCTRCDEILSIPEDDPNDIGHQCSCHMPWFWLASVEQDEEGRRGAELHAVLGTGRYETVDRRSY